MTHGVEKGILISMKTISDMKIGETAMVTGLTCTGALRRRIIDMGLTPGAAVLLRKTAPMGDPLELNVRGYSLSIRLDQAKTIQIELVEP